MQTTVPEEEGEEEEEDLSPLLLRTPPSVRKAGESSCSRRRDGGIPQARLGSSGFSRVVVRRYLNTPMQQQPLSLQRYFFWGGGERFVKGSFCYRRAGLCVHVFWNISPTEFYGMDLGLLPHY